MGNIAHLTHLGPFDCLFVYSRLSNFSAIRRLILYPEFLALLAKYLCRFTKIL
jgi:hypothetical protein